MLELNKMRLKCFEIEHDEIKALYDNYAKKEIDALHVQENELKESLKKIWDTVSISITLSFIWARYWKCFS